MKNNARVEFIFDAKSLKYYMYINVYFKNSTFQYKIQIKREDYEMCKHEEKKDEQ